MQAKTTNKFVCVVLALLMLLMSVSFTGLSFSASAAETGYVLEASALTAAPDAGTFTDGQSVKAGTDNYFTLVYSAKTKIDSSEKTWDDGYTSKQRINFGGKATTEKNAVKFTTDGAASVKVWFAEGGDDNRQMTIIDASGNEVASTKGTYEKNKAYLETLTVPAAGTYFLGGKENNNYIFKVEVTGTAPTKEYEFVSSSLAKADAGAFTDGQAVKAGTDGYFTLYYSAKTKLDGSDKTFDDGFVVTKDTARLNFGGKADASVPKNCIGFKTSGAANIKVWWVEGADNAERQMVILDASGNVVAKTNNTTLAKNDPCVSALQVPSAGTYFLGGDVGNNYIFKVKVTEGGAVVIRKDWDKVMPPLVNNVKINADNNANIDVRVVADIGADGGDAVKVIMYDEKGNEVDSKQSLAEERGHTITFTPSASGKYTFKAVLIRDGYPDKNGSTGSIDFTLPLGKSAISSATSKGNGKVELCWSPVPEATGYNVYCNGTKVAATADTSYMVTGLTVGEKCKFTVAAIRGSEEGPQSAALSATVTKDEKQTWGWVRFGTSTDDANNGYVGSLNEDGKVTVYSENGKGKIQSSSNDGISFYYTPVPTNKNFTLRANVHVDNWDFSNGQEGFGLVALDSIPEVNSSNVFWTNSYMAAATLISYRYDATKTNNLYNGVVFDGTGDKYSMYIGLGVDTKLGMTKENIDAIYASPTGLIEYGQYPLDLSLAKNGAAAGDYNMIGNCTNSDKLRGPSYKQMTDFILEIQRNNTGYFLSYYTSDGTLVKTQKFYDTEALDQLDEDNVYVGFFAARRARATFSNVKFTTVDPKDDAPAEARPVEKIDANLVISSAAFSNTASYKLLVTPNVSGKVDVLDGGKPLAEGVDVKADTLASIPFGLFGNTNQLTIIFTPDAKQDLGEGKALASTEPVTYEYVVTYDDYFANQKNIYVSPNAGAYGNGGPDYPLSIYEAVKVVQPGQKIVLMEGTYKLNKQLVIERGIDGTAEAPIYMIADPNAKTRPVFDMQSKVNGIIAAGDYWYFSGFDVTKSGNNNGGFHLCGSYNILNDINAYENSDSGIYIHAYRNASDPRELWPHDNLVLNCTSFNNADTGYENADGFACKLTTGDNNVFDGCVSYNNADDGWDCYARASSGSIGAVTIKNCVAFNNGYLLDGTNAGNGNGFKMGGESLPAGHTIINSIAFNNKAKGIDCNSCPDIHVINCTSYNNESFNVALYTGNATISTDFSSEGTISFKDSAIKSGKGEADSFKPQGTQDASKFGGESNYVWDGSASTNSKNVKVSADWFKSLEFKGVKRNADGSINMQGFLELTDKAPKNAGARMTATKVAKVEVTADENLPAPRTGVELPVVILIVLLAATVTVLIVKRKRA
ncbi:MAG: hypothetical protein MSH49_02590 [[Eubacterium] saphenum]|nr:hypothetical protein [[Eubacterium] saphenum]